MLIEVPLTKPIKINKPEKPPIKWAGSKSRMLERYYNAGFFPKSDPKIFVDMFAGSCVMAYWVRQLWHDLPIIINDKNPELIQMYNSIKSYDQFIAYFNNYASLYARLSVEDRKKHYYELREIYRFPDKNLDPIHESAILCYLLKTGYNGIWQSMKASGNRYATSAGNMLWKPQGSVFDNDAIKRFSQFLHTCIISCESFENMSKWFQKNAWFYADPPYRESIAKYIAAGEFNDEHQKQLVRFMQDTHASNGLISMSNREHLETKMKWTMTSYGKSWSSGGWFGNYFTSDWTMVIFKDIKYTAGRHNTGPGNTALEVLIKNY